jgi:hypothetical protein
MLPAELEEALPMEDDEDAAVEDAEAVLLRVRPWNECEATSDMTPASPTAPAIIQRFSRVTRASPRSRARIEAIRCSRARSASRRCSRAVLEARLDTLSSSARARRPLLIEGENPLIAGAVGGVDARTRSAASSGRPVPR